jgi:hypothetical protein
MSTSTTTTAGTSGNRRIRLALVALFLVGVAVQFYLAGRGAFGASSYDAHEALGGILHGVSLLILIASVAIPATRNRVDIGLAAVLFVLASIQMGIASFEHPELGAFHPFNAILILGAAAGLLSRDRRLGDGPAARTTASV